MSILESTVNAIQADPDLAKFKFRLNNKWGNGGHNHSTVGNFLRAKLSSQSIIGPPPSSARED